ncbi:MAG TPA: hypothetical protein VF892_21210, partial [Pseudonocardiaceae bacterium]
PPARLIFFAMVDALEQIPSLSTEHDRAALINQLPQAIANTVSYSTRRRIQAINLLTACQAYQGGVDSLIDVIRAVDGDHCVPLRRLAELAAQLP